jgi:hypothetical protein
LNKHLDIVLIAIKRWCIDRHQLQLNLA